ncbi:MAG: trypsin-like peptidase domain-containing protein [Lentisphaeria bacterium]
MRLLTFLFSLAFTVSAVDDFESINQSLIRLTVAGQKPDYRIPWNPGRSSSGSGSGFVIGERRIMTNAHVISNSRFIELEKDGDPERYQAQVKFVAHDCDLAILEVDDPDFFEGTQALEFGNIPALHSTVYAFGYPIGGERMSVTRGVVSRIEFRTYSHSGLDSHLSIQVDAAINPGNSGGPVIQNGKVVGVAFQGYSGAVAQNTGYMIPTPVIRRFLADIEDGSYDGYAELAVEHSNLLNPVDREYLGMSPGMTGVRVTNVMSVGSAFGVLEEDDVLIAIDGHPIDNNGHIKLEEEYVQFAEIIERKFHGDSVGFDIFREGAPLTVTVRLRGAWPYLIYRNEYDKRPRYVLFAGLLFQPMSRDFMSAHKVKNPQIKYLYDFYITDEIFEERPEVVILSSILTDHINTYLGGFTMSVIDEINDLKIKRMADLAAAFAEPADQYVIRTIDGGPPIVIDAVNVEGARKRIVSNYHVTSEQYLGPEDDQ